jgi:hypothetical protein
MLDTWYYDLYKSKYASDENGHFLVKSPYYQTPWYCSLVTGKVRVVGGDMVQYSAGGINWPAPNDIVTYDKVRFKYTEAFEVWDVYDGEFKDFKTWNDMVVAFVEIEDGGSALFHTRQEIAIENGFHAKQGSEVHIWTEPTFANCSSPSYHMMIDQPEDKPTLERSSDLSVSTLQLQFELPESTYWIKVAPNPVQDVLSVEVSAAGASVKLRDLSGKVVWAGTMSSTTLRIPCHRFATGEYVLEVEWSDYREAEQVSIQHH